MKATVEGIGFKDMALAGTDPLYRVWASMLRRANPKRLADTQPTYMDATVIDEWRYLSNFYNWAITQAWEGRQLDKDIIQEGNREYGPHTCCFVTAEINNLYKGVYKTNNGLPVGVKVASPRRWQAKLGSQYIGCYESPEDAGNAVKIRRAQRSYELALQETDPIVKEALLRRYQNAKTVFSL